MLLRNDTMQICILFPNPHAIKWICYDGFNRREWTQVWKF